MMHGQGPGIGRRAFLAGLSGAVGLALAGHLRLRDGSVPVSFAERVDRFVASLSPGQRRHIVLPADHPSRAVINTVAVLKRPHLGTLLDGPQRSALGEILDAMLSDTGRDRFRGTFALEGPVDGGVVLVYDIPGAPEVVVSGGHFTVRDPRSPLGSFAWGQQLGNETWRVAGNAFAVQSDAANALLDAMSASERARAVVARDVRVHEQFVTQVQLERGSFEGIPGAAMNDAARERFSELLDTVLGTFAPERANRDRDAIDARGGLDTLHFATWRNRGFLPDMRTVADDPEREDAAYYQVWRIEGPGTVIHVEGHPHVHAYANIAPREPLAIGEVLAELEAPLTEEGLRAMLERAMREATGEAMAWHDARVNGRFPAGTIDEGRAWSVDPFGSEVGVATIDGAAMSTELVARLFGAGASVAPGPHRIATTPYLAAQPSFGGAVSFEPIGTTMRETLVATIRAGALEQPVT